MNASFSSGEVYCLSITLSIVHIITIGDVGMPNVIGDCTNDKAQSIREDFEIYRVEVSIYIDVGSSFVYIKSLRNPCW